MEYFRLDPEVAGGLGKGTVMDRGRHPPIISRLHFQFEGWLGDDLLESFPCFIVTAKLGEMIAGTTLTGQELLPVQVSKSNEISELHPSVILPAFLWLKVTGIGGKEDFGLSQDYRLMVSQRALDTIKRCKLNHCDISIP